MVMTPVKFGFGSSDPVVVAGGGAAGLSCALSAAAMGADVVLLEKTGELGGTVTQSLIHTLGGLFDDQGHVLNAGLPEELAERLGQASPETHRRRIGKAWVLNVDPGVYARVVADWVRSTPSIEVLYHSTITRLSKQNGHVTQIEISHHTENRILNPSALVDATGNARIVSLAHPDCVAEGEALGGVIFQLRGVAAGALEFPKGIALIREIRNRVEAHELPSECSTVWLDTGVYPDEAYVKFNVTSESHRDNVLQAAAQKLLKFLKTLSGFEKAFIGAYGRLGVRDGGRIRGEHCLTEAEIKSAQRFADVACRGSWPIEHWHPQSGISLEYLGAGQTYDIPLRCLKVAGFNNLWAVGKCLSAEPRAQASARVVGTCWAMGAALGQYLCGN